MATTGDTVRPSRHVLSRGFDAHLGEAAERYFGNGYRRTRYDVAPFSGAVPPSSGDAGVEAVARVHYPLDWSRRGGRPRVAHLSTLDALVLSGRAVSRALALLLGLSAEEVRRSWFAELTVRTGARPVESLDEVPVTCSVTDTRNVSGRFRSELHLKVGSFTVTTLVRHPAPGRRPADDPSELGTGPYRDLYREVEHRADIRTIDTRAGIIESVNEALSPRPPGPVDGIEAAFWPQPTLIDSLVFAGQMAQVLIFATDDTERERAGNLWLRRITFASDGPERAPQSHASLTIINRRDLSRGDTVLHGVDVRCEDVFGVGITAQAAYAESAR